MLFTDTMSMGERFINSLGITILGMLIVFVVLIILSLCLELLRIIGRDKKKSQTSEPVEVSPKNEQAVETTSQEDDSEIIAVIAAAIASLSGSSIESFNIRSIRPLPQKNNIWSTTGRQDRMLERL